MLDVDHLQASLRAKPRDGGERVIEQMLMVDRIELDVINHVLDVRRFDDRNARRRKQCRDTAELVGLYDRGLLSPGYRADINVIDYDHLTLKAPEVAYDLPTGGRRLLQRAKGYTATILAGQVTYRDGEPTDALPGRLLRGARAAPTALAAE